MAMGQGKGAKDDHHMIEAAGGSNLDFGLKPAVKGMVGGLAAGRVGGKGKAGSNNILCKFGVHCLRDNCFFVIMAIYIGSECDGLCKFCTTLKQPHLFRVRWWVYLPTSTSCCFLELASLISPSPLFFF